ncbi:MAG: hypothetical protein HY260_21820 [Chloroflexi bacterium]|nr:hypothetical protein [Chloroflexota bacterium]
MLTLRWPMRFVGGLGGLFLIAVELRAETVTNSLQRALTSRRGAAILVGLVAFASGSYYLLPGQIALSSDALGYTGYAYLARQSLQLGQWPIWSNFAAMGTPLLQFYGFYPALAGLVGLAQPDMFEATKFLELALHVISVFGMFAFASRLTGSRAAGAAAAWAYGFTFYRYHAIVFTGIVHMGVHLALMPWQFYAVEEFVFGRRPKLAWAGFTVLGGLGILGHPHYGAYMIGFALLYGLIRVGLSSPSDSLGGKVKSSLWLIGGFVGSLLLGSYPVVGTVIENSLVATGRYQGALVFALGPLKFREVFTFLGSYWSSDWFGGYVGISITLIAIAALAIAAWQRDRRSIPLGVCFVLSLYLALGPGRLPFDSIFQRIPLGWLVYVFSTPGRYLLYVTFFGTAAVGVATLYLERLATSVVGIQSVRDALARLRRAGAIDSASTGVELAAIAAILIVSVDMIPLSMQANALRPPGYGADVQRAYAWLRGNATDRTTRILDPAADLGIVDVQLYSGLPAFGSTLHDVPEQNYEAVTRFASAVLEDYKAGAMRPLTRDWLYLMNASALVSDLAAPPGERANVVFASGPVSVIGNASHSAVLASGRVEVVPDESLGRLLERLRINRQRNSAEFIPLMDAMPGSAPLSPLPVSIQALSHEVRPQYVRLTYEVSDPAYVQLSYAYYPYLAVRLDGKAITAGQSPFGLIVFRSEKGMHTVELIPYLSPLRVALLAAGLAYLLGTAALIVWEWSGAGRMATPRRVN